MPSCGSHLQSSFQFTKRKDPSLLLSKISFLSSRLLQSSLPFPWIVSIKTDTRIYFAHIHFFALPFQWTIVKYFSEPWLCNLLIIWYWCLDILSIAFSTCCGNWSLLTKIIWCIVLFSATWNCALPSEPRQKSPLAKTSRTTQMTLKWRSLTPRPVILTIRVSSIERGERAR